MKGFENFVINKDMVGNGENVLKLKNDEE